jgi:hypothetical protein
MSQVLVASFSITVTADEKKPKDLILGKWESVDGVSKGVVVEFKADGTTTATFKERTISTGKYKFVEDDVMEFEPTFLGKGEKLTVRFRMKIAGDELTQTDLNTKIEKHLKRVK